MPTSEGNRITYNGHIFERFVNYKGEYELRLAYIADEKRCVIPGSVDGIPVTEIEPLVFYNNTDIEYVELPDTITKIGNRAFSHCENLKEIVLPDSITSIGQQAFWQCESLSEITLGNNVTELGEEAFGYCENMKTAVLSDNITELNNGTFRGCRKLEKLTLPKNLTKIHGPLCYLCSELKHIDIPDGVEYIGDSAFANCENLNNVKLPNQLRKIGNFAFSECNSFTEIIIPDCVEFIGYGAFEKCSSLQKITLPKRMKLIPDSMCMDCQQLTKAVLPESCDEIDNSAFFNTAIENIILPADIKTIGRNVFQNTPWLGKMHSDSDMLIFNGCLYSYQGTSQELIIPKGVTRISAFFDTPEKLILPDSLTILTPWAFAKCPNIREVSLGKYVTHIEANAFTETAIEELTLPDSVTNVVITAFDKEFFHNEDTEIIPVRYKGKLYTTENKSELFANFNTTPPKREMPYGLLV